MRKIGKVEGTGRGSGATHVEGARDPGRLIRFTFGAVATTLAVLLAAGCGDSQTPFLGRTDSGGPSGGTRPEAAVATAPTPTSSPETGPASGGEAIVDPVESPVTYEEAEAVFDSGDYRLAVTLFERYSERVPTNPWGPYMAGISAWRDSDHEKAETFLRRTLELDSGHIKARLNLARVLLESGKPSDALAFASEVTERNPESAEAWRVLGNVHGELGVVGAAEDAYRRAIALDPGDAWTMNNLGLLRIEEGRYGDAIPPLARATELRPDVARFQNNLGVALERTGRMAQAVDAYGAALVADESYDKAKVSFERTSALVSRSTMPPVDLAMQASMFANEVSRWRGETVAELPTTAESPPSDSPDSP